MVEVGVVVDLLIDLIDGLQSAGFGKLPIEGTLFNHPYVFDHQKISRGN